MLFNVFRQLTAGVLAVVLVFTGQPAVGASTVVVPAMPVPGTLVSLSPAYTPAHLQGITVDPNDPFQFSFLVHRSEEVLSSQHKNEEYTKIVKYFLAALTIPDKDQWVNLSPYESGRIIEGDLGKTEMGRDLLAQDYLLKQVASSLLYPESGLGKEFWVQVLSKARKIYGDTQIPLNSINKVWITPNEAVVYEKGNSAFILKSHLKVMLEEDYLALAKNNTVPGLPWGQKGPATSDQAALMRSIILPAIEKQVNEGKHFAPLRQIVASMILATWYKQALKESIIGKVYADRAKINGVNIGASVNASLGGPSQIYAQYLQAFKKGVFNYIKDDQDDMTRRVIPRKYFSGGFVRDAAMSVKVVNGNNVPLTDYYADVLRSFRDPDQQTLDQVTTRINGLSGARDQKEAAGFRAALRRQENFPTPRESFPVPLGPEVFAQMPEASNHPRSFLIDQSDQRSIIKLILQHYQNKPFDALVTVTRFSGKKRVTLTTIENSPQGKLKVQEVIARAASLKDVMILPLSVYKAEGAMEIGFNNNVDLVSLGEEDALQIAFVVDALNDLWRREERKVDDQEIRELVNERIKQRAALKPTDVTYAAAQTILDRFQQEAVNGQWTGVLDYFSTNARGQKVVYPPDLKVIDKLKYAGKSGEDYTFNDHLKAGIMVPFQASAVKDGIELRLAELEGIPKEARNVLQQRIDLLNQALEEKRQKQEQLRLMLQSSALPLEPNIDNIAQAVYGFSMEKVSKLHNGVEYGSTEGYLSLTSSGIARMISGVHPVYQVIRGHTKQWIDRSIFTQADLIVPVTIKRGVLFLRPMTKEELGGGDPLVYNQWILRAAKPYIVKVNQQLDSVMHTERQFYQEAQTRKSILRRALASFAGSVRSALKAVPKFNYTFDDALFDFGGWVSGLVNDQTREISLVLPKDAAFNFSKFSRLFIDPSLVEKLITMKLRDPRLEAQVKQKEMKVDAYWSQIADNKNGLFFKDAKGDLRIKNGINWELKNFILKMTGGDENTADYKLIWSFLIGLESSKEIDMPWQEQLQAVRGVKGYFDVQRNKMYLEEKVGSLSLKNRPDLRDGFIKGRFIPVRIEPIELSKKDGIRIFGYKARSVSTAEYDVNLPDISTKNDHLEMMLHDINGQFMKQVLRPLVKPGERTVPPKEESFVHAFSDLVIWGIGGLTGLNYVVDKLKHLRADKHEGEAEDALFDTLMPLKLSGEETVSPKGGIDLNAANFGLIIKRDGNGIVLPLSMQDLKAFDQIDGFEPKIIEIKPAANIPILNEILGSISPKRP